MRLSTNQVKGIISDLREQGYNVGVRDIAYVFLCRHFEDHRLVHRALFPDTDDTVDADLYDVSDSLTAIKETLDMNYADEHAPQAESDKEKDEAISFDELKQGLVDDMKSLEELRDMKTEDGKPALEPKEMATVVGRIADLRVKLTEKYGATQKEDNHRVVVVSKYSKICPHCGKEY